MADEWYDINQFFQVCAWQANRSHSVNAVGVSDVVTLHLQDGRSHEITTIVMPTDIAIKLGWDLIGEGGGFFAVRPESAIDAENFD